MKITHKLLMTAGMLSIISMGAAHAQTSVITTESATTQTIIKPVPANTVTSTTQTVVTPVDLPNMEKTNFAAFDLNKDGILDMAEVGTKLFYIFDTDGNEVIDNIEFKNKKVMTIIPMEKETFKFVDYNSDGAADDTAYTHESFFKTSGLMRFDQNMDGLSPHDFVEQTFLVLDDNNSKAIELDEWKEAYIDYARPAVAEQERYGQ